MNTNVSRPEKDTDRTAARALAREHIHDPQFLGIDSDGNYHFWSLSRATIVVVSDGSADALQLPARHDPTGERIQDLSDWVPRVEWQVGPNYVSHVTEDLE